ncbi:MAG: hypothetical protein MK207_12420 [Saprospiraceae bacterium]|nr:hypothetical protein [Saprospiraceae bacterium]
MNVIGIVVLAFFFLSASVKRVQEKTAKIVQRLGKFNRILHQGINFIIPIIENIAGTVNLKVQELDIILKTKTQDDVYVKLKVSLQVQIIKNKVREAFYELDDPYGHISSRIFDIIRTQVPKLNLNDVFSRKDDIAVTLKKALTRHMEKYGYKIVDALITDVDPVLSDDASLENNDSDDTPIENNSSDDDLSEHLID